MPGGTLPLIGNNAFAQTIYASLTPAASVTAATSTTSTYTISGLVIGDVVDIFPQSALTALLAVGSVWVSAANTLSIQWINSSASNSTASPTAIGCILLVVRPSLGYAGYANYPTII